MSLGVQGSLFANEFFDGVDSGKVLGDEPPGNDRHAIVQPKKFSPPGSNNRVLAESYSSERDESVENEKVWSNKNDDVDVLLSNRISRFLEQSQEFEIVPQVAPRPLKPFALSQSSREKCAGFFADFL